MKKSTILLATASALALSGCNKPATPAADEEPVHKSARNPWSKDVPSDAASGGASGSASGSASASPTPKPAAKPKRAPAPDD